MSACIDITIFFSYLHSTSNLALSCRGFAWRVKSNGFPIKTSVGKLCLENLAFYRSLVCPFIDEWLTKQVVLAIGANDPAQLSLLLEHKADLEAKTRYGGTALIRATKQGKTKCLQILLDHKADVNARNNYGSTALISGIDGNVDCLKLLLQNKADVGARNYAGYTALDIAAWDGRRDFLRELLKHGAQVRPHLRLEYPQYEDLWGDSTL